MPCKLRFIIPSKAVEEEEEEEEEEEGEKQK